MKDLDTHGNCPECGSSWDGGSIHDTYKETHPLLTEEEINTQVETYYSPPYRWSNLMGIEYDGMDYCHYDGISEYQCQDCKARFNRWTGKVLQDNEKVKPFGKVVKR
jgi:hypothetical protein